MYVGDLRVTPSEKWAGDEGHWFLLSDQMFRACVWSVDITGV